jgi:hypothetical protein
MEKLNELFSLELCLRDLKYLIYDKLSRRCEVIEYVDHVCLLIGDKVITLKKEKQNGNARIKD